MSTSISWPSSNSDEARVERIFRQAEGIQKIPYEPRNDPFYYNPAKEREIEVTKPLKKQRTESYKPEQQTTTAALLQPKKVDTEKKPKGKEEDVKMIQPIHKQSNEKKKTSTNDDPPRKRKHIEIVVLSDSDSC